MTLSPFHQVFGVHFVVLPPIHRVLRLGDIHIRNCRSTPRGHVQLLHPPSQDSRCANTRFLFIFFS